MRRNAPIHKNRAADIGLSAALNYLLKRSVVQPSMNSMMFVRTLASLKPNFSSRTL